MSQSEKIIYIKLKFDKPTLFCMLWVSCSFYGERIFIFTMGNILQMIILQKLVNKMYSSRYLITEPV